MRIIALICCCICTVTSVFSQQISCQLKDSKTHLPIQYANIGIVGKNIGTVSDSLGNFQLSLTNASKTDILRISMIAYESKNYLISELRLNAMPSIINLDERINELNEVVINNKKHKLIQLGLQKKHCYPIPLYKGSQCKIAFPQKQYQHEIGTRITNSEHISLDSVQLNFAECNVSELNLRLNVYAINSDSIKNILTKPIYIKLSKNESLNFPIINLTSYNIEVDSDFLVTIENYKQLKDGSLFFLANFKSNGSAFPTYYRSNSQGNWIKLQAKKNQPIGLSILAFAH